MERVQVFVRIKPTNNFAHEVLELSSNTKSIVVHHTKRKDDEVIGYINNQVLDWEFSMDGILHNVSQEEVYKKCASQLVSKTLEGYNNTLFAYGQTGAGKTYTMTGTTNNFQHRGIIPRAIADLYQSIGAQHDYDIDVYISYLEIYKEEMYDLLAPLSPQTHRDSLIITEDDKGSTYIKGLSCHHARIEEEALNLLFEGETNRIISQHQLNHNSSRSHCIFTINVESHSRTQSNTTYTTSKFNLVDLAGSERLGKTLSHGITQEEAMYINKSLTFLEQTFIALEDKRRCHVPYRQCKLTHVLKDTLAGTCNTVMIGNIWGEAAQIEETLSTLRFAARVMNVPSQPAVNSFENPTLLCRKYEKEIISLRRELAMHDTLANRNQVNYEPLSEVQIQDIRLQVRRYLEDDQQEIDIVNFRQVKEVFTQFKCVMKMMEADFESKFKEGQKTLEKVDVPDKIMDNTVAVQHEKTGLVGEPDGNSFSIGQPSEHVKPAQPSPIVNAKKKNKKAKDSSLASVPGPTQADPKTSQEGLTASTAADVIQDRVSSPPLKEDAFEMFKEGHGKCFNTLFTENKEILREKKSEAKKLVEIINSYKNEIDETKAKLDLQSGSSLNEVTRNGEIILDEEVFELIQKLKCLKADYRMKYEHLQNVRTDITYCEKLVKQCRQNLLLEFQTWYKESFGIAFESTSDLSPTSQGENTLSQKEDDGEKFDRIQREMLMKCPESVAFYNARIQTDRRKLYKNAKPKNPPGSVTTSLRNAPPTTMFIR